MKAILLSHGIEVKEENNQLFACEEGTIYKDGSVTTYQDWVNVTGWSLKKLYCWLGY